MIGEPFWRANSAATAPGIAAAAIGSVRGGGDGSGASAADGSAMLSATARCCRAVRSAVSFAPSPKIAEHPATHGSLRGEPITPASRQNAWSQGMLRRMAELMSPTML